jgi:spermidine synthase
MPGKAAKKLRDDKPAAAAADGLNRVPARTWFMRSSAALKLLVFVAGAVLMGLEIAGSRVLAPHFGNSVFVWGSLISVFLTALAAGYYLGGRLADRYPSQRLLNIVLMAVAAWIFLLVVIGHPICRGLLDRGCGDRLGPLLGSAILFLLPSVGLGIVSPLSIRIAATSISSVGQVAGTLYALSTVGSIAGTLLATFVLIPLIGVAAILKILGGVLLLTALVTFPRVADNRDKGALLLALMLVPGGWLLPAAPAVPLRQGDIVRVDETTPYHHIWVLDNTLRQSRQLRFDKYAESSIRLVPPYRTLDNYTNYFHLAFLLRSGMERVLFIGAGGGVGPRTFATHDHELNIDVVDIDPRVLTVAKEYFFLPTSAAMRLFAQDGRMFLREADSKYDCIVLDAYTIGGRIPFHLVTREFFDLCRARLTEDGVFVMNLGSALDGPKSGLYHTLHRTLATAFRQIYVFPLNRVKTDPRKTNNLVVVATSQPARLSPVDWTSRAGQYDSASYIDRPMMQLLVADLLDGTTADENAPIFTDDYAPIETLAF